MRYLVHFSGGMDSVASIIKTMDKDPGGVYDLLHVSVRPACDNYWQAQLCSVLNLVKGLRGTYKKAKFNLLEIPYVNQARGTSLEIAFIMLFTCIRLREHKDGYSAILNGTIDSILTVGGDWDKAVQMLNLYDIHIPFILPVELLQKKDLYNLIPEELQKLTWACNFPIKTGDFFEPCGKCSKCRELDAAGIAGNIISCEALYETIETYNKHKKEITPILKGLTI